MVFDLRSLLVVDGETLNLDLNFDFSKVDFAGAYPFLKPAQVKGTIANRAGVVSLVAHVTTEYTAECDRCDTLCTQPMSVFCNYTLVTHMENDEERDDFLVVNDMSINMQDFALSEIILNLPSKHLCKPDCKGLCAVCGKNLNEGQCACSEQEIDPRLEALKQLLD